ncbi:MAG: transcription termination factor Rho [Acidimicrobiales bacterium]|nr:transcription termination factor Rho [Acidimicrobiales bacterium]
MDSTELQREVLEEKGRDELTTIATALGGKPGSRARKAEIVDLILDLAGDNGAAVASSNGAPDRSDQPLAEWELAVADDGDSAEVAETTDHDAGRADPRPTDDDGEPTGPGPVGGDRQASERNRPDQQFSESGNRRRRRRGRGPERAPEEAWDGEPVAIEGHLDLRTEGYGFLRTTGFKPSKKDAYVSVKQVRQFDLRRGDRLAGAARPANRSEKNPALLRVDTVNDRPPDEAAKRPKFEDLTPLFPDERLRLEVDGDAENMTSRIVDLLSPIGKGQRGLIVSPPKAGKTMIMKQMARSIETNNPEVKLIVLLVDERPEEVTDMKRWLISGEVLSSTFDRPPEEHTAIAEVTIERAKRLVEYGEDVVILLDGITRLSRAYNLAVGPGTGRIMSGGLDTGALYPPKKFFGAARNVEEGGSLTIIGTALVETGSKMDEVIFEEFKGTGNMELRLDRRIAERRVYPAIDVNASSTRHEELLFDRKQLNQVWKLRRVLNGLANDGDSGSGAGLELLIDRLKTFPNNDEFLAEVAKGPSMGA